MTFAIVVETLLWLFVGDWFVSMTMHSLCWLLLAVVGFAFLGKGGGVVVARWRMLRLVRRATASTQLRSPETHTWNESAARPKYG